MKEEITGTKKKIITLDTEEELFIVNKVDNTILKVKNENGKLITNTTKNRNLKSNTEIMNISFEELKRFILFEDYYQNIMALDVKDDIKKKVNELMDYHFINVYGENYYKPNKEIDSVEYQCIVSYKDE